MAACPPPSQTVVGGMVSLLVPTDRGVGGAEPGTVALGPFRPPVVALWGVSGGRRPGDGAPRAGAGSPTPPSPAAAPQAPGLLACLGPRRPGPPSGSAGEEEETWLPPGDNARESLGSTSRRAGAVPPPALPPGPPPPEPRAVPGWVRVQLTLLRPPRALASGALTHRTGFQCVFFFPFPALIIGCPKARSESQEVGPELLVVTEGLTARSLPT